MADEFVGTFRKHSIVITRDSEDRDWYIRVRTPSGRHLYDGYWPDSAGKPIKDALYEAKVGALLIPRAPSMDPEAARDATAAGASEPDWKSLYEDAMHASNEAGCVGMTAAETIRYLDFDRNAPVDMLLFCPKCGMQHIDEPDDESEALEKMARGEAAWDNPPHRSHLCGRCKTVWRPADVPTNGVAALKTRGKDDTWSASAVPQRQDALVPPGYKVVPLEKLTKLAMLIDPEPVEVGGVRMVCKNPAAQETLTLISAEVRKLIEYRPPADQEGE